MLGRRVIRNYFGKRIPPTPRKLCGRFIIIRIKAFKSIPSGIHYSCSFLPLPSSTRFTLAKSHSVCEIFVIESLRWYPGIRYRPEFCVVERRYNLFAKQTASDVIRFFSSPPLHHTYNVIGSNNIIHGKL